MSQERLRAAGLEVVTMACVCNNRWAAQMKMAPDADIADGLLEVVEVLPRSIEVLPRALEVYV